MMKRNSIFIAIGLMLLAILLGCDGQQFGAAQKTERAATAKVMAIPSVDDFELAKMLLKPRKYDLDVSRDPFKPLMVETVNQSPVEPDLDVVNIESMKYFGVVRLNNENAAFLKSNVSRGIYRVNDEINGFTVTQISDEEVVFSNGKRTITLRRVE